MKKLMLNKGTSTEIESQMQNKAMVTKVGRRSREINWEIGTVIYTTIHQIGS